MAIIREERPTSRPVTLADQFRELKNKVTLLEKEKETKKATKQFKFPLRWRLKFSQAKRKRNSEKMLVFYLNKKNEIEPPRFMPIFDGNMIVWKNKPYEFDPRAVWTIKSVRGNPKAYLIKEIDRRPVRNKQGKVIYKDSAVSNMDLDEIRDRGDSTESDEFLIKAAIKAQKSEQKKQMSVAAMVILGLIVVGGLVWFFAS